MTIEQLKSPAVREWTKANRHLPTEQKLEEFYKWAENNIELINESVKNNIDQINESFNKSLERAKLLVENVNEEYDDDDDDDFWGGDNNSAKNNNNTELETEISDEDGYTNSTISGKRILTDSLTNAKSNIFSCINAFYEDMVADGTCQDDNPHIWGQLDVSKVTNMTALFAFADIRNADLSSWDTSSVKTMEGMFYKSTFDNNSISNWIVKECESFLRMFTLSDFNGNISRWQLKEIKIPVLDASGNPVKLPNGETKTKVSTVRPPMIGANANEEMELINKYWVDILKGFKEKASENKEGEENKEENIKESKKMKHILDYETFINEGFGDFIKKGFDKVKSLLKNTTLKLGNFIASFDSNGKYIAASDPYTALNFITDGQVEGVSAYTNVKNEYLNDNVESTAKLIESPEYYGIIDKNSIEYKNYQTMVEMVNEHYNKYGDTLNEANGRIGFSGADGGLLDSRDINSKRLYFHLNNIMLNTPYDKGKNYSGPILIWGAPGIGKSSIPDSVIRAWNEKNDKKKTLMVIECGNLTVDGFSLPMPTTKKIGQYMKEQPLAMEQVADKVGAIEQAIEEIEISVSDDVVKSWLPVYKETNDKKLNVIMNAKVNGGHIEEYVKDEKTGKYNKEVFETTEGGILLFDEFFRANAQVFKILMQILLNRRFNNDMVLGDKWSIIACSNRPNDDDEVSDGYTSTGAVIGTRFSQQYNFVPDFDEWKKWAIDHGNFDEGTIAFLQMEKDPVTGEYTNWHTIRPNEYEKGKSGWPTPRTWSKLMVELNNVMQNEHYNSINEIPYDIIEDFAAGAIGNKLGKEYTRFISTYYTKFQPAEVLNNPDYIIPEDLNAAETIKRLEQHIKAMKELPTDIQMMNMFNKLENTFKGHLENITKILYISLLEKFDIYKNAETVYNTYKKFIKAIVTKYNLKATAPDKDTAIKYTLENIQNFCQGELPRHN